MAEIRFHISAERAKELTWDEQAVIEGWQDGEHPKVRQVLDITSQFVMDDKGVYLERADARRLLGSYKGEQVENALMDFINALGEFMLPKENGNKSLSPSTPTATDPVG